MTQQADELALLNFQIDIFERNIGLAVGQWENLIDVINNNKGSHRLG
ncbi:hypothetical protein [Leptolyngbya sp. 7M]|nr:hypothetical protein [Leptolyngbya sp. 7M]